MGQIIDCQDGRTGMPEGDSPGIVAAELAAGLERVREHVHRWIDRLGEGLGAGVPAPAPGGDLERAARELDERWEALRAEAERRDREWAERVEALEQERQLLADAWERLEREQLAAAPPDPGPARAIPPAPPRAAPASDEPENSVDRAILHQFEALRRDVRRKSEARRRG